LNLLALDTTGKLSGIIYEGKQGKISIRREFVAEDIPYILGERKISIDDIDRLGICIGPGSFTGIRVGLSFIKAVKLVKNIPVFGISAFYAMVKASGKDGKIMPVVALRRGYYSTSIYKNGKIIKEPETFTHPELEKTAEEVDFILAGQDSKFNLEAKKVVEVDILSGIFGLLKEKVGNGEMPKVEIKPFYGARSIAEEKREKKYIEFISAENKHLNEVFKIEKDSFPYPWDREEFEKILLNPYHIFTIGIKDDEILGYIIATREWDELHILNLAVRKQYRKMGIGHSFLHLIIKEAKKSEVKNIYLEVRISNDTAISLYKSFGFTISKVIPGYYYDKEDAVVMELYLS